MKRFTLIFSFILAINFISGQPEQEEELVVNSVVEIVEIPSGEIPSIVNIFNATDFVIIEDPDKPEFERAFTLAWGKSIAVSNDLQLSIDQNNAYNKFFAESIIRQRAIIPEGGDTRQRVTATQNAPWRYIGKVGQWCAGSLIGPRHVLTAAHCVWNSQSGKLWDDLAFTPAIDGRTKPYGTIAWQTAFLPDEFKFGLNREFDYAIIILKDRIGDRIGSLGVGEECATKQYYTLNIAGYPHDKFPSDTMWATSCTGLKLLCSKRMFDHRCDTFGGMSGSPMFVYRPQASGAKFSVRGIHTNAVKVGGQVYNQGITITPTVLSKIRGWMNQYA